MPRKKSTNIPIIFGGSPRATRKYKTRKIMTDFRQETGDPEQDGDIWLQRIAMTRRQRANRRNGERQWTRYYRWFEGYQWNDRGDEAGQVNSDNSRDTATVNKTGSIINSIVPFLINDDIEFSLKPRRPTDFVSAMIQQSLLNYEWNKQKMTDKLRMCARDLVIIGHCVGKTGYTVEVDAAKKPERDGEIVYNDFVRRDSPFVERINPINFFFDLSARDNTLHTARWCAECFFVPFIDVLVNPQYDRQTIMMMRGGEFTPTSRLNWEANAEVGVKTSQERMLFTLPEDHLIVLIEIWDKKFKKRMIYADGCNRPLFHEDWPFTYMPNFPYAMCQYITVPNQPYGIGLPAWIEDQQIELNRSRSNSINWRRANQPKFTADPDIGEQEIGKFTDGPAGTVISARAGSLVPIPEAKLSIDFQLVEQQIQRDIEEMTGADALMQGQPLPPRTTAGEVGVRARLTGLKLDQHVTDFETFVEEIATNILHHLKAFRTTADVIEIVGDQGTYWREYTADEIQADTDLTVNYFAAPKSDPSLERQQRLQIMQLAVQSLPVLGQQGQMVFDIPQLFRWVLETFNETDFARFFIPARIPLQPFPQGQQGQGQQGGMGQIPAPGIGAPPGLGPPGGAPPQGAGAGAGPGAGLPPALAGGLAPAPIPTTPGLPTTGAPNVEALMQQMRGFAQPGG